MLCLPSTVPPPERNSTSWTSLPSFFRNRSHHYGVVLNLQVGKNFVSLFGFNFAERRKWGAGYYGYLVKLAYYGHSGESERIVPEPVLSHRLANVAISCMQHLYCCDSNTLSMQVHFLTRRVTKWKQSPWLWRRRMRVTSMGR